MKNLITKSLLSVLLFGCATSVVTADIDEEAFSFVKSMLPSSVHGHVRTMLEKS